MKIKNIAALYSIIMGTAMIGSWTLFYTTGNIPELQTEPVRTGIHLIAEFVTAIWFIVSGFGLLYNQKWRFNSYLFSMGMLVYTLIVSPGYFAQKGDIIFV